MLATSSSLSNDIIAFQKWQNKISLSQEWTDNEKMMRINWICVFEALTASITFFAIHSPCGKWNHVWQCSQSDESTCNYEVHGQGKYWQMLISLEKSEAETWWSSCDRVEWSTAFCRNICRLVHEKVALTVSVVGREQIDITTLNPRSTNVSKLSMGFIPELNFLVDNPGIQFATSFFCLSMKLFLELEDSFRTKYKEDLDAHSIISKYSHTDEWRNPNHLFN